MSWDLSLVGWGPGLQYPTLNGPVHTPDNNMQVGHPTCIIEGLACSLTLCILEQIVYNFLDNVQISFIQALKLIAFSWTMHWCYWQNVLMINEKNKFLTVSWLSGLLSAEIFISTGATTDRWKQSSFAVRVSGGCPGNVLQKIERRDLITISFGPT